MSTAAVSSVSVTRLASERSTLFNRSGSSFGLSAADQNRLRVVERELDECFGALREIRAVRTRHGSAARILSSGARSRGTAKRYPGPDGLPERYGVNSPSNSSAPFCTRP